MINIHNIFKCVLLLFVAGLLVAPVVAVDYNFTQTINYTACDQPTYQQDIEIHRSVGNNYEEDLGALNIWHIYVGDSCQNDYDDLRFDDGANQELAYYLWPDYDNNSAKFNVNLTDADNIGAVTIKYGNNTVSTTSDGEATFPFFDQFEGIALNTTKWITAPGATVSVSGGDVYVRRGTGASNDLHGIRGNVVYNTSQYMVQWNNLSYPGTEYSHWGWGDNATAISCENQMSFRINVGKQHVLEKSGVYDIADMAWTTTTGSYGVVRSGDVAQYLVDGAIEFSINDSVHVPTVALSPGMVANSNTDDLVASSIVVRVFSEEIPLFISPVTNFTATPVFGVAPQIVQFSDTTSNVPISWLWTFGDGNNSTLQNPSHTYENAGIYSVTLNATNQAGYDIETKTNYVSMYELIEAEFSSDIQSAVTNENITFTDASNGTPTSWVWDFGDGETSVLQNPVHSYAIAGNYTVNLTATNPANNDTESKTDYIKIYDPAVANFSSDIQIVLVDETVEFTDESTGFLVSWLWDFGDGETATVQNPTHSYATTGNYTVNLTVTNTVSNDTKTETDYIAVYDPIVADFSSDTQVEFTDISINFTDLSTGAPSLWHWDFGDGENSTDQNPIHTYASEGNYTVSLVTSNPASNGTKIKNEYIVIYAQLGADFSSDKHYAIINETVTFTDTSGGDVESWLWNFGDNESATTQNPEHQYADIGIYDVSLTITNPAGNDTEIKLDYIDVGSVPLVENIAVSKYYGVKNETVSFAANFTDTNTVIWYFGDGSNSTIFYPNHIYTENGHYNVTVAATNEYGTTSVESIDMVYVGELPEASFIASPLGGVIPLFVTFLDGSIGAVDYVWSYGDGETATVSGSHNYTYTEGGNMSVYLNVSNNWGYDEYGIDDYILIATTPLSVDFSADVTSGFESLNVTFTPDIEGTYTHILWNFGDGETSSDISPYHVYADDGVYSVSLYATSDWESEITFKDDYISVWDALTVDFEGEPRIGYLPLVVNYTSTITGNYTGVLWSFGDGATSGDINPSHTYVDVGEFTVTLEVWNEGIVSEGKPGYVTTVVFNIPQEGAIYPQSNYDMQNTRKIPGYLGDGASMIWECAEIGGDAQGKSSPIIDKNGYIYFGNYAGGFGKIDPDTGETEWINTQINKAINSPALRSDGGIYVSQGDGATLVCLSPLDGSIILNISYGVLQGSPVINSNGYVVLLTEGIDNNTAINLMSAQGDKIWTQNLSEWVGDITPAIDPNNDDMIYVNTNDDDNHLYAFSEGSEQMWSLALPAPSGETSPVVGTDGRICVGMYSDGIGAQVWCVDSEGAVNWQTDLDGYFISSLAMPEDNTVVVVATDETTYARYLKKLSANSGVVLWSALLSYGESASIITDDGYYYACGSWGYDLIDQYGQVLTSVSYPPMWTDTIIANGDSGVMYGVETDGVLIALDTDVVNPLTVGFTISSMTGVAPAVVTFTDISTSDVAITERHWSVGNVSYDGVELTEISHTFELPGIYLVMLSVVDENGYSGYAESPGAIVISEAMPIDVEDPFPEEYPEYGDIRTMGVTDVTGYSATLWGEITGDAKDVWIEYGSDINKYGHRANVGEAEGEFSAHLDGMESGLIAGETYYYRAACDDGYGEQKAFIMSKVGNYEQTDYTKNADKFIFIYEDPDNAVTDVTESIWSPYMNMFGTAFVALVIGAIFFNLAAKQRKLFIPSLLILLVGGTLLALLPPEAMMMAQMMLILSIAGMVYWFMTRR